METVIAAAITGAFVFAAAVWQGRKTRREVSIPDSDATLGEEVATVKQQVTRNSRRLDNLDTNVTAMSGAFLAQLSREHETTREVQRRLDGGEDVADIMRDIAQRRLEERGIDG